MTIPKRKTRRTDWLDAEFKEQLENQSFESGLNAKLSKRVVGVAWQILPQTTAVYDGVLQGARNTYWVNPDGEVLHVGHASEHNWREEGKLAQRGPWFRLPDEALERHKQHWAREVDAANEQRDAAVKELAELKDKLAKLIGYESCEEW
ncbi:hypothetical protein G7068_11920 [Leucobacter viscericola]|uniref:Uncharacterized protein n=1 Tax=Leucobacter viscericola TaxID=2714935 RepID=A0A6G7XH62_9MICO|nr:hypothetical protein [Leucobacter viscericola]QIK63816.1 hypothetical protein G7068_11920 [Leucobacter viscericola]